MSQEQHYLTIVKESNKIRTFNLQRRNLDMNVSLLMFLHEIELLNFNLRQRA
jgi:hypothetical protein